MPRLPWPDLAIFAFFAVVYTTCHVMFCLLQEAPLPWDESYLMVQPTKVALALREHGIGAAWDTFWQTHVTKPTLCAFGNLPAMLLFGDGHLSLRLDNLVLTLGLAWFVMRALRQWIHPSLALGFATLLVVSPYALMFSRAELAELYIWCSTALYVVFLQRTQGFAERKQCVWLGVAMGLGMLSKASFPLVVIGPTAWVIGRTLLDREMRATLVRRALNGGLTLAVGLALCLPFYVNNYDEIKSHVDSQYSWAADEYSIGDPHTIEYLERYASTWTAHLGESWMLLLVLAGIALPLLALLQRRALARLPLGLLGAGIVVNLVYCYHHPVFDMRFTFGSFLMLQLATALVLGTAAAKLPAGVAAALGRLLVVPAVLILLANSFVPGSRERILFEGQQVAYIGPVDGLLELEQACPDLRDAALDHLAPEHAACVVMVGDTRHFNSNNLDLKLLERGVPMAVFQLCYLHRDLDAEARVRHPYGSQATTWIVVEGTDAADPAATSPFQRHGRAIHRLMQANPDVFARQPWVGELTGDYKVYVYHRVAEIDEGLVVPG